MRQYLMLFEDQSVSKTDRVIEEDLKAARAGILDIVDITDPENPKQWDDGEWVEVEKWAPYGETEEG